MDQAVCIEADERVVLTNLPGLSDAPCWTGTCDERFRRIVPALEALHESAFRGL